MICMPHRVKVFIADPSSIKFQLDGDGAARIDQNSDLVVRLGDHEVRQLRPIIYQDWDGSRHFKEKRQERATVCCRSSSKMKLC